METALISIVIPCYNRCELLQRCLRNLKKQSYPNIEIIVVDDGSQDGTEAIMRKYSDSNIRYYRYSPNRGACYGRNYGIQKAQGEYIAFQDSDDLWRPEKLEEQMRYLKKTHADMVFCGMYRYEEGMRNVSYYPPKGFDSPQSVFQQLLKQNRISTQTILAKKCIFDEVKFDPAFKRFQDWDFALQTAKAGYKIEYVSKPLVISEIQQDSITAMVKNEESYKRILNKYKEDYESNPRAYAQTVYNMADSLKDTEREKAIKYFERSLKYCFNLRVFFELCLLKMHIKI